MRRLPTCASLPVMLGLFGRFGRARDLRHLDDALRSAGLHPALVSDAVKMTVIRLLKAVHGETDPHIPDAAALLAFCIMGPGPFAETNGAEAADAVTHRIHAAIAAESSLDAEIVLLAIHAETLHPDVIEDFGLDADG